MQASNAMLRGRVSEEFTWINGKLYKATIGELSAQTMQPTNNNRAVIDAVSEFLAEFK